MRGLLAAHALAVTERAFWTKGALLACALASVVIIAIRGPLQTAVMSGGIWAYYELFA
jgi:hypothetical protein